VARIRKPRRSERHGRHPVNGSGGLVFRDRKTASVRESRAVRRNIRPIPVKSTPKHGAKALSHRLEQHRAGRTLSANVLAVIQSQETRVQRADAVGRGDVNRPA